MGQSIYFTSEQLDYLEKLVDSFDEGDAENEGAYEEARVLQEVSHKVLMAIIKDRK